MFPTNRNPFYAGFGNKVNVSLLCDTPYMKSIFLKVPVVVYLLIFAESFKPDDAPTKRMFLLVFLSWEWLRTRI